MSTAPEGISMKLIIVLCVLMVVNQIIGTSYGSLTEGFKKEKLLNGLWKMGTILAGYAAIAFSARWAGQYISGIEYLSGILLEPIAKYFLKIVDKLKNLLNEDGLANNYPEKK